jgi:hypothetical protein
MSLEPLHPRRFGSESAVAAHWVSRCDGFRVVVGHKDAGTVERAVFDTDPLDPVALRVRRPHGQTRLIPLTELESVEPLSRVLYFRKRPGRGAAAGRRVSVGATQLRRRTSTGARGAALVVARSTARHWPSLRRGLIAAAKVALALLVFGVRFVLALLLFAARTLVALIRAAVTRLRSQPTPLSRRAGA